MNQAILFNDDIYFDQAKNAWSFTCLLNGECIQILITGQNYPSDLQVTSAVKFDWEDAVEVWLENNEPEENQLIKLSFK